MEKYELENIVFDGLQLDVKISNVRIGFGDLFLIVGTEHPRHPPRTKKLAALSLFNFDQIDDYFGIRNVSNIGDDVTVWLYPLLDGQVITHHAGPYEGFRLSFSILRNSIADQEIFEKLFTFIAKEYDAMITFNGVELEDIDQLKSLIKRLTAYCLDELRVKPGSDAALSLDF